MLDRIDTYGPPPNNNNNNMSMAGSSSRLDIGGGGLNGFDSSQSNRFDKKTSFYQRYSHSLNFNSELNYIMENSYADKPIPDIVRKRLRQENTFKLLEFASAHIYKQKPSPESIWKPIAQPGDTTSQAQQSPALREGVTSHIFNETSNGTSITTFSTSNQTIFLGNMLKIHSNNVNGGVRVKQGKCMELYADGGYFFGEFEKNQKHGSGVEVNKFSERYEGEFVCGERTGEGSFFYANGDVYVGPFVNGMRHGNGRLVLYETCQTFTGVFTQDRFDNDVLLKYFTGVTDDNRVLSQQVSGALNSARRRDEQYVLRECDLKDFKSRQEAIHLQQKQSAQNAITVKQSQQTLHPVQEQLSQKIIKSEQNQSCMNSTDDDDSFTFAPRKQKRDSQKQQKTDACCGLFNNGFFQFFKSQ